MILLNRATVEQLLNQNQEFQQLQQELLQQDGQHQQMDEQLNFALHQSQFPTSQSMDLLMSGDQSQQTQVRDDGSGMNAGSMNACQNTMQAEMDQMLDIDLMQVLKCFESAPAGGLGDLAGGLSLFNDMDVMNIG